jgi:hypothetical protein
MKPQRNDVPARSRQNKREMRKDPADVRDTVCAILLQIRAAAAHRLGASRASLRVIVEPFAAVRAGPADALLGEPLVSPLPPDRLQILDTPGVVRVAIIAENRQLPARVFLALEAELDRPSAGTLPDLAARGVLRWHIAPAAVTGDIGRTGLRAWDIAGRVVGLVNQHHVAGAAVQTAVGIKAVRTRCDLVGFGSRCRAAGVAAGAGGSLATAAHTQCHAATEGRLQEVSPVHDRVSKVHGLSGRVAPPTLPAGWRAEWPASRGPGWPGASSR